VAKIVANVADNIGDASKLRSLRNEVRGIAEQLERI
jgi:hypothetical protein